MHPDEQCVRSCLNGQAADFRHLVERYETAVSRYLHARLGNAEAAAEAAQETFVRAYFALGELRKPAAFFSWLLGIADRVAKETRRARQRQCSWDGQRLESATATASEDMREDAQADASLSEAVAGLPDVYREVVVRRFYGGQSCAEISRELDVRLGTVTKRLSRAYALLRERLASQFPNRTNEVS